LKAVLSSGVSSRKYFQEARGKFGKEEDPRTWPRKFCAFTCATPIFEAPGSGGTKGPVRAEYDA